MTEWRRVPGYPDYEASRDGRVRSHRRRGEPREIAINPSQGGRHRQRLTAPDGSRDMLLRSVIVLTTFVGPRPPGMHAAHENGNPGDDRVENLTWKTPQGNYWDRHRHGIVRIVTRELADRVRAAREMAPTRSTRDLGAEFDMSHSTVQRILNGRHRHPLLREVS